MCLPPVFRALLLERPVDGLTMLYHHHHLQRSHSTSTREKHDKKKHYSAVALKDGPVAAYPPWVARCDKALATMAWLGFPRIPYPLLRQSVGNGHAVQCSPSTRVAARSPPGVEL